MSTIFTLPTTATAQDCLAELGKLAQQIKEAISSTADEATVSAKDLFAYLAGVKNEITAKADLVKTICAKEGATIEEATAVYIAAKEASAQVATLTAEVTTLRQEKMTGRVNALIGKFKSADEGKIIPATEDSMRTWAMKDYDACEAFLKNAPRISPLGALPEGGGGNTVAAKGITEADVEIGKVYGLSKEDIAKFNPPKK